MSKTTQFKTVEGIQNSEPKLKIHGFIKGQGIGFAKQIKSGLSLLTLPSTEWKFEKGLISDCRKNGVKINNMFGVEKNSKYFETFEKNAPKIADTFRGDFDEHMKDGFEKKNGKPIFVNLIWGDYCGHPAEHFYNKNGKDRYRYPHILAIRDTIINAGKRPLIIYATFRCDGSRLSGGADKMMKALSPNANSIHTAVKHKISQTLHTYGLSDRVTQILDVYYHGSGHAFMLTVGYAVNFKPKFPTIKENWVKTKKTAKASYVGVKIDYAGIRKEAMKSLCDLGWTTEKIAHALKTQKGKVGSVLAWHKHRDSWQKVA